MSDDKVRPLIKAVADLPAHHTGLVLDVVNKLRGENSSQVALAVQQALQRPPVAVSRNAAPIVQAVKTLLEDMESVMVVIDSTINPSKVLQTTKATAEAEALWVNKAFAKILVKATGAVPTSVTMKPRRLKDSVKDGKIKDELPTVHEIDPTAFVHMLATELTKVRSGKASSVLAKNRWCLFYVAGLVVYADWDSGDSEWRVDVWMLDDRTWDAGHVMFSCN